MSELTHWRKLTNPDFIGSDSLYDKEGKRFDLNVKCIRVTKKEVPSERGKEMCSVMELEGQKPFILNTTNNKMLAKIFGTPMIELWAGKVFTLYVADVKIKGEFTECLRIRPSLPQVSLPELLSNHPQWSVIKADVASKKVTVAALRKTFTVSAETEKLLNETV